MFPMRDDLFKTQNCPVNFIPVETVQLFLDAREDARRAAGADELDFAGFVFQRGFKLRAHFAVKELSQPIAALGEFAARRRVAVRKFF